ncbi:MAG: beta-lactamase family protein [Pyrinomonadaceae bacterium]|nr:beta-lactamase family protein [Pyrinomonadaceae bacterium]
MKTFLTTACLFVVTTVAIIPFIASTVFGQEKKTAKVPPSPAESVTPHVSGAPAASKPILEGLDEFIVEQMKEWNVPGLAIAIVRDGKVIHSKGYGFRDVEKQLPVTPKTLFAIGSITKSFAVVTLGMLADEGKLDWDKPVREYVRNFRLYDPVATERITMRDLVSHRSGLPGHDFFMYEVGLSQKEMIESLWSWILRIPKALRC